jgi:hypothetical protein
VRPTVRSPARRGCRQLGPRSRETSTRPILPDLVADRQVMVASVGAVRRFRIQVDPVGWVNGYRYIPAGRGLLCGPAVTTHLFVGEIL